LLDKVLLIDFGKNMQQLPFEEQSQKKPKKPFFAPFLETISIYSYGGLSDFWAVFGFFGFFWLSPFSLSFAVLLILLFFVMFYILLME
jgi:hypothetical protein